MGKKGMLGFDEFPGWVIALLVLILMVTLFIIFKTKGEGILEYIKNIWRYG